MDKFIRLMVLFHLGLLGSGATGTEVIRRGMHRPQRPTCVATLPADSAEGRWISAQPDGGAPISFHRGQSARAIPFSLEDHVPLIKARLNNAVTVNILVDTGFGSKGVLLFDPEIARRLKLQATSRIPLGGAGGQAPRTVDVGGLVELDLPGVTFRSVPTLVATEKRFFQDWPCDGIIGCTLFSDCLVEIDSVDNRLSFFPPGTKLPANPGEAFDLRFSYGIPVIEGLATIGSQTIRVNLMVDTGAALPFILFRYSHAELGPPGRAITFKGEGINGIASMTLGRIASFRIGPYLLREPLTGFMDEESMGTAAILGQNGFLGPQTLQNFHAFFDYPGKRLYLRPHDRQPAPWEFNMAGLALKILPGRRLIVFDVVAESPASQAQIRPGDRILTVDGRSVEELSYLQVYGLFVREGKTLRLTLERQGRQITHRLVLKRLI